MMCREPTFVMSLSLCQDEGPTSPAHPVPSGYPEGNTHYTHLIFCDLVQGFSS